MHPFTRHFFSRILGRAVGTVRISKTGQANVEIALTERNEPAWVSDFQAHQLTAEPGAQDVEELALRTAIAHLQRVATLPGEQAHPAMHGIRPWIGDFHEGGGLPGAGATGSYQERRAPGQLLEDMVACGVDLMQLEGRHAARSFLQHARVPPSVIRRVLSNSSHRRKAAGDS